MNTVLYFQSKSKTSAPEKLAGVREIMDKKRIHVQVIHDQAATARLAARELLETGFNAFAFVHYQERRA